MKKFLTVIGLLLMSAGSARAVDLSARLSAPDSPTSRQELDLDFVVLDRLGRSVEVRCYVKKPGVVGFSVFDGLMSLQAGGDSGSCETDSSVLNDDGVYEFKVTAVAGADTVESNVVSVDYDGDAPSTPVNYSKSKDSCEYKIKFKTADDGRTSRVDIYRSESKTFNADAGSKIGSVGIGPDAEGEFTNGVPSCVGTYYYVIRAFADNGLGSGLIGDSEVVATITTTTTEGASGTSGGGQILGALSVNEDESSVRRSRGSVQEDGEGEVLGDADATSSAEAEADGPAIVEGKMTSGDQMSQWVTVGLAVLAIAVAGGAIWWGRKFVKI